MVKRIFLFAACLSASCVTCFAQAETIPVRKFNHYVGVQANQLIRQIINLNNTNSTVDNPYLLTYSINMVEGGWGFAAGAGYNYQDILDKIPVAKESKINNLFYRFGVNRRFMIGKRFEAGYGLDFVGDYQVNKTVSTSVTVAGASVDSSTSNAITKTTSWGLGPQFYLGFYFSNRLILGTETSYYYVKSSQKQNVLTTDNVTDQFNNPVVSTSNANIESTITKFSFSFPVALFLILKF